MNFKVGDIVRGTEVHTNPARMSDKGFVANIWKNQIWVLWFGSKYDVQVAYEHELELLWRDPVGYLE